MATLYGQFHFNGYASFDRSVPCVKNICKIRQLTIFRTLRFLLLLVSLPFATFSSTFTLFNFYPRRENYVFNGYLCRVMCTELIDIRLRRYARLFLPCLLNIDRWQDRVTPKEKALLLVCCAKYTFDETYRSRSIPMVRMYYSVVREYKLCHIFREVHGNRAGGVCCFRKKCIIIFFNYFKNLPSRCGTFMFT